MLVNSFSKYCSTLTLSNIVQHGLHVWWRVSRVSGSVSDTSESHRSVWLPVTALLQNTANYLIDGGGVMRMKRWNIIKERCIFRYGLYILMFCDNRDISEAKLSSNTRPRPIIRSSASLCTGTKYKTAAAADTEFIFYLFNCLCSPSHFKLDIPLIVSCNSADVNFRKVHRNRSKLSVKRSKDESWSSQSFRFCCCCWVSRKIAVGGSLFKLKGKSVGHGH